jgi:hypothetical protein
MASGALHCESIGLLLSGGSLSDSPFLDDSPPERSLEPGYAPQRVIPDLDFYMALLN